MKNRRMDVCKSPMLALSFEVERKILEPYLKKNSRISLNGF